MIVSVHAHQDHLEGARVAATVHVTLVADNAKHRPVVVGISELRRNFSRAVGAEAEVELGLVARRPSACRWRRRRRGTMAAGRDGGGSPVVV